MGAAHNVIRIKGSLPGGEVWSVNPRFNGLLGEQLQQYDDLLAWTNAIAALNTANVLPTALRALMSSQSSITSIRAEFIGADGKLVQVAENVFLTPKLGTGTITKPLTTAVVSSLRTGRAGRSYRGRLYWPALAVTLETANARLADTNCVALAGEVATFLKAVGTAAPGSLNMGPVVVSQTLGVATKITSISVGDIPDTQRRRRDSLQEAYASATL